MPAPISALRHRLGATLDLPRAFVSSMSDVLTASHFEEVEAYCMFLGYARSGHSLLGSLLDAHPDVVIAHELDALRYLRGAFGRAQVYSLILQNARRFADGGDVFLTSR